MENAGLSRTTSEVRFWFGVTVLVVVVVSACVALIVRSYPKTQSEQLLADLRRGNEFLDAKAYDQAIFYYSQAIESETDEQWRSQWLRLRGSCFFEQEKFEQAIRDFTT